MVPFTLYIKSYIIYCMHIICTYVSVRCGITLQHKPVSSDSCEEAVFRTVSVLAMITLSPISGLITIT